MQEKTRQKIKGDFLATGVLDFRVKLKIYLIKMV
jgi:hypothetical protein